MKLHEEFKLYENMWEQLNETASKRPVPPAMLKIVKIEPKIIKEYEKGKKWRHYDKITYVDPYFNNEYYSEVYEGTPGYGLYFGWGHKHSGNWNYAAYDYQGNLLQGVDPNGYMSPKLKKAIEHTVDEINNPTEDINLEEAAVDTVIITPESLDEKIMIAKKDLALAKKIDRKACDIWESVEERHQDEDEVCARLGILEFSSIEIFDKLAADAGLDYDVVDD